MEDPQQRNITADEKERLVDAETQRVLIKSRQAGVPLSNICVPRQQIASIIDPISLKRTGLVDYLYDKPSEWAKRNTFIVIDGGDYERRHKVACACLVRGIMAHANSIVDQVAIMKRLSELSIYFSSFDQERFRILRKMQYVACLLVTEFDKDIVVRGNSDARTIFQDLLAARRTEGRPTIVTLCQTTNLFAGPSAKTFGSVFDEIIGKIVADKVSPNDNIIHIRCHAKTIKEH